MIYKFSRFEVASIKRNMMNIAPLTKKKEKLMSKKDAIDKEIEELNQKIEAYNQILEPVTKGIDPNIILCAENHTVEIMDSVEEPPVMTEEVAPEPIPEAHMYVGPEFN